MSGILRAMTIIIEKTSCIPTSHYLWIRQLAHVIIRSVKQRYSAAGSSHFVIQEGAENLQLSRKSKYSPGNTLSRSSWNPPYGPSVRRLTFGYGDNPCILYDASIS